MPSPKTAATTSSCWTARADLDLTVYGPTIFIIRRESLQTGETHSYYQDFGGSLAELIDCLGHGWLYRGQPSRFLGLARGTEGKRAAARIIRPLPVEARSDRQSRAWRAPWRRDPSCRLPRAFHHSLPHSLHSHVVYGTGSGARARHSFVFLRSQAGTRPGDRRRDDEELASFTGNFPISAVWALIPDPKARPKTFYTLEALLDRKRPPAARWIAKALP